ncbi:MAG: hypothetical protein ABSC20_07950 [Candidatus Bathyarchaeia archaeon]|jgi:hypothetical protein
MNRKIKVLALISVIVVATIAASLIFAMSTVKADTTPAVASDVASPSSSVNATNNGCFFNNGYMGFGGPGGPGRMGRGFGGCGGFGGANFSNGTFFGGLGSIQVSSAFTQNVTNILQNNPDVQNLLNQGYNITSIRPVISTVINGNGNVVMQATTADVILQGTNGRALVVVDLTSATVTKIVTTTVTYPSTS